jgi:hypothetical protein
MWDHYTKTFKWMQAAIVLVTFGVFYSMQHSWPIAVGFFLVMQLGSLVGALWATRLRRKIQLSQLR